jgi:hypothetical protein
MGRNSGHWSYAARVGLAGFIAVLSLALAPQFAGATSGYPPATGSVTSCSAGAVVAVGSTYTLTSTCQFEPGSLITVTLNGSSYDTLTAPASGFLIEIIAVTDPHISLNGGPRDLASYVGNETFVATGTNPAGATNTVTTVITIPSASAPAATGTGTLAFTGADLVATVVGGLAFLIMGMLLTVFARRRATAHNSVVQTLS